MSKIQKSQIIQTQQSQAHEIIANDRAQGSSTGSKRPRQKKILERLSSGKDPKIQQVWHKLNNEDFQKKQNLRYVHNVKQTNSRQDIIPGKTEIQDEEVRQQMLVGKMKYN